MPKSKQSNIFNTILSDSEDKIVIGNQIGFIKNKYRNLIDKFLKPKISTRLE